ncbi:MAG: hypothetical protein DSY81_01535 [Bacillota bacterium]|nr:MAG: hypothetical protein DSY92_11555 [Planctomycetota bacterium]RUA11096.1 MAG: hypothetical protein DSY81_01535 [Bacillota bacterium]
MVDINRRRRIAPFNGASFCFFLTLMTLVLLIVGRPINSGSLIPFLSFLPICFLSVGYTMKDLQDRILVLEAEKAERLVETKQGQ